MPSALALKSAIAARAAELGFDAFGVAEARPLNVERERLRQWLARDYHGTMAYLSRHEAARCDPQELLAGARSVLCFAHNYLREDSTARDESGSSVRIARYARGRDYHRVLRGKLRAIVRFVAERAPKAGMRICVDTTPILEKAWAENAGLGWRGKHTNLVSHAFGSWTILGEILTTLALPADDAHLDFCGSCRRCLDACPTDAFPRPYVMDARRCISFLTIEHRGAFDETQAGMIDDHLFGCDACLEVCPWNRFQSETTEADFHSRPALASLSADEWANLDPENYDLLLAGSALRRAGLDGLRRNAAAIQRNRVHSDD
jgi:epoxyqueuosine reductase